MQSKKLVSKFYDNYLENYRKEQPEIVPARFKEWFKFDYRIKNGVFATKCPFCSSEKVKEGIHIDTKKTGLRDKRYIEYQCIKCGSHFLI